MRALIPNAIIVAISILLFSSCYEPSVTNYNDLKEPAEPTTFMIDYFNSIDTIFAEPNFPIVFRYDAGQYQLRWAACVIDSNEKDMIECKIENSKFTLSSLNLNPNSTHTIDVYIFTNSHTGSLADKLGQEGFMGHRRWILRYLPSGGMLPDIIKSELVGGVQTFLINPASYCYAPFYIEKSFDQTKWTYVEICNGMVAQDLKYAGEECYYRVSCLHNGKIESDIYKMSNRLPNIKVECSTSGIRFSWDKSPYKNVECYEIVHDGQTLAVQNIDQNYYSIPYTKTIRSEYSVYFLSKYNQKYSSRESNSVYCKPAIYYGEELLPERLRNSYVFNTINFEGSNGKFIYFTEYSTASRTKKLLIYDSEANAITDSITIPYAKVTLSANGEWVANYDDPGHEFVTINIPSKKISDVMWFNYYSSKNATYSVAISNNGIITYSDNLQIRIYNAKSGGFISTEKGVPGCYLSISPDGNIVLVGSSRRLVIFERNGDVYSQTFDKYFSDVTDISFIAGSNKEYMIQSNEGFSIGTVGDTTFKQTLTKYSTKDAQLDPFGRIVSINSDNAVSFYSLDSESLLSTFTNPRNKGTYFIFNNYVYCGMNARTKIL